MQIIINETCAVRGRHLAVGAKLTVPADLSKDDAETLVAIGRASKVGAGQATAGRK